MIRYLTRRSVLGGIASLCAGVTAAAPLEQSLRPRARPGEPAPALPRADARPAARNSLEDIIAELGLSGVASVMIADAQNGEVIEDVAAEMELPPASVTKALTALYAHHTLGPNYRFVTKLLATGPAVDGIIQGDLILAGGGDPTLTTDHLAGLVDDLVALGISGITGRLHLWDGALRYTEEIEPGQLDYLGYNPSVSGLNLNFNVVHFQWVRNGGTYDLSLDARTELYQPQVSLTKVRIAEREVPVFTYEGQDSWTVARAAMGQGGTRWLPVRQPALFAGEVFRTLAEGAGITLPEGRLIFDEPEGGEIARNESVELDRILKGMLLYSTNLTAEICGQVATAARLGQPLSIPSSAAEMTNWLRVHYGVETEFHDHSGLSDKNRISAAQMVHILLRDGSDGALRPLLKTIPIRDIEGNRIEDYPATIQAKTGTLNFVSTLAGFIDTPDTGVLAFAIFCGDLEKREAGIRSGDEVPYGSITFNTNAKRLQQLILQRWGLTYIASPQ